jgi:60Kd inner membrane protein
METAPLSRRLGALAIDMLVGLPVFAGMIAAIVAVTRPWKTAARSTEDAPILDAAVDAGTGSGEDRRLPKRPQPGSAADGDPAGRCPQRRACLAPKRGRAGVVVVQHEVAAHTATCPLRRRSEARLQALQPQLKTIQHQHRDDEETRGRATMDFYKEHDINPLSSCGPGLLAARRSLSPGPLDAPTPNPPGAARGRRCRAGPATVKARAGGSAYATRRPSPRRALVGPSEASAGRSVSATPTRAPPASHAARPRTQTRRRPASAASPTVDCL